MIVVIHNIMLIILADVFFTMLCRIYSERSYVSYTPSCSVNPTTFCCWGNAWWLYIFYRFCPFNTIVIWSSCSDSGCPPVLFY